MSSGLKIQLAASIVGAVVATLVAHWMSKRLA